MQAFGWCIEDRYSCNLDGAIASSVDSAYSCPQMHREHWMSFNGTWKFAYDDAGQFSRPADVALWTHMVEVPFTPNSNRSSSGDTGFHPN